MPRFLDPGEPLTRAGTPGTSGESGSSEGKKKGKKKKRRGPETSASGGEIIVDVKPSTSFMEEPRTEDVRAETIVDVESDGDGVQKESIIVEPWIPPPVTPPKQSRTTTQPISRPSTPTTTPSSFGSPSGSPRRAAPIQCARPSPTILSEYPLLSNLPSMIPALPTLTDVRAAGRVTKNAGMALVGSVRDGYVVRLKGESSEHGKHGKERNRHSVRRHRSSTARRGSDSFGSSEGSISSGEDSDAEVLVDAEDAEGMAESWRGVAPDEGALGLGWMKWRTCRWERHKDRYVPSSHQDLQELTLAPYRRLLISINPTPQTALQITDCTSLDAQHSAMHMLHPETIDMGNSTIIQTAPFEVLHIPRARPRVAEEANAFACEECEVMDGVADDVQMREDDEEVLVDCALSRPVEDSPRWIFL